MDEGIDVVIRAHDPARLEELGRAVFSAALQDLRPVRVIVVCQRFDSAALAGVGGMLGPIMAVVPDAALEVLNGPGPGDARAALLNLGLAHGRGRYAAILDVGDVIYPEAYRLLIGELQASGAAVAAGGVWIAETDRSGLVPYVVGKTAAPTDPAAWPLHVVVLDRTRIDAAALLGDEAVPDGDRAMLVRLCGRCAVSTRLQGVMLGERLVASGRLA